MATSPALLRAQEAAKEKQWGRALELYDEAVAVAPTAEALAGRAQVHNKLGNHMEAAADAGAAIELDGKLAAAHKEKGHACYSLEEFESALDAFEAAAELEPAKRIHKSWVDMCRVQLGEPLPAPPTPADVLDRQAQAAQGGDEASGSGSGADAALGQAPGSISLQGPELRAFMQRFRAGGLQGMPGPQQPEAEEEAGTAQPKHVRADDPEFSKYWKAPIAGSVAASISDKPQGSKYRHQWFQSPERVEVDVLAKGLKKEQVGVTIEARRLRVVAIGAEGQEEYDLDVQLHGEVVPSQSRWEVLGSKVEVKLSKAGAGHWPALEARRDGGAPATPAAAAPEPAATAAAEPAPAALPDQPTPAYPYAGKKVDWDRFAKELQQEEKEEKLEGDQALMKFFRELYDGGDEDTRRAMVKSMQESGGTALSMNWQEVGKQDYASKGKEGDDSL